MGLPAAGSRKRTASVFVISNAYERLSLIITTNLTFNEWGPLFTDDQLAAAIIDRIVHYGHLINTGNKDWRLEHALMKD